MSQDLTSGDVDRLCANRVELSGTLDKSTQFGCIGHGCNFYTKCDKIIMKEKGLMASRGLWLIFDRLLMILSLYIISFLCEAGVCNCLLKKNK